MKNNQERDRLLAPVLRHFRSAPLEFDEQGFAMLTTEDRFCIHIHAPDNSDDLNLFILLGNLPKRKRENLLVYAMGSNWLNRRTRGSVLSVAGEDETLMLQRHLSRKQATPDQLERIVPEMKRVAEIWRAIFNRVEEEAKTAGEPPGERVFDPAQLGDRINAFRFA